MTVERHVAMLRNIFNSDNHHYRYHSVQNDILLSQKKETFLYMCRYKLPSVGLRELFVESGRSIFCIISIDFMDLPNFFVLFQYSKPNDFY